MLWAEALLMSTHNIRFHREIRKILCGYPLLSVAMSTSIAYYIWDFFCLTSALLLSLLIQLSPQNWVLHWIAQQLEQ